MSSTPARRARRAFQRKVNKLTPTQREALFLEMSTRMLQDKANAAANAAAEAAANKNVTKEEGANAEKNV